MAYVALVSAIVLAVACPPPHALDEAHASPEVLAQQLRACSLEAERQRALLAAVKAVLSSGDTPGLAAAARAVLASASVDEPESTGALAVSATSSARKSLPTWHENVHEQRQAQLAQLQLIRDRTTEGRPQAVVRVQPRLDEARHWTVACQPLLYTLGLPAVPNCTPAIGARDGGGAGGGDGGGMMPCGRAVIDGLLDEGERLSMLGVFERTMRGLFHQGAITSFAPESKSAPRHMGVDGVQLFENVSARVRRAIEAEFGTTVYPAGALLTRIWADHLVPDDGMDVSPGHAYAKPHVDKANRASYDYSALLYINSHCSWASSTDGGGGEAGDCAYEDASMPDFDGGRFAWLDESRDLVVEPRGGRLLAFTGGLENLHHGQKVLAGTRYVMGFWFTCHPELEYKDDDDEAEDREERGKRPAALTPPRRDARRSEPPPPLQPAAPVDPVAAAASQELYERLNKQQQRLQEVAAQDRGGRRPQPPPRRRVAEQQHVVSADGSEVAGGRRGGDAPGEAAMERAIDEYAQALQDFDRITTA